LDENGHFVVISIRAKNRLFLGSFFRGQGGLLSELKKWLILGVEKEPKNALKNGLKMR